MSQPLQFNLKSNAIPVTLSGDNGAPAVQLELREMNAASRDRYLDSMASRMRFDAEGKPSGVKKFDGMQAELLSLCLFDSEGKRVSVTEIQAWPASVVTQLFDAAQRQNHLAGAESPAKNG